MTDVIEYVRRSTLIMTNLNTVHKRKGRSRLYHIVENDFPTTKCKLDLSTADKVTKESSSKILFIHTQFRFATVLGLFHL